MTQNQYFGADINPVIAETDPNAFLQKAIKALQQVADNNFTERAQALAAEIADWQPDVVGLQEVLDFGCIALGPTNEPIITNGPPPFRNHLSDTLDALAALGEDYVPVATVNNIDISLPIPFASCQGLRILDRDVILVRGDHVQDEDKPAPVPFCEGPADSEEDLAQSGDGCNYPEADSLYVPRLGGPLKRGFVGVDVTIRGERYRFVNTHLEQRDLPSKMDATVPAQVAQAEELIGILQDPRFAGPPTIVMGDINSSPGEISYEQFITANFNDAWDLRPGNAPGLTCCQAEDLSNRRSELYERIDMIFTNFEPRKVKARLVGHRVSDKTRPGRLWPSDHAGVVAEIRVD
jgi:endonuclease/exonuclease/phosphatase family metal-dependent hydrolase